jgi:Peptidase propeptide and YPEB domain
MPRRSWLFSLVLAFGLGAVGACYFPPSAMAKDGGESSHDGGNDGGGDHGGSGGGGGGGDNGGSGGAGGGGHGDNGHDGGSGYGGGWDNSSSYQARSVVKDGEALSLSKVIPTVRQAISGQVLDVDLLRLKGGGWVYKFRVLARDGAYLEVFVDALSNRILQTRRR